MDNKESKEVSLDENLEVVQPPRERFKGKFFSKKKSEPVIVDEVKVEEKPSVDSQTEELEKPEPVQEEVKSLSKEEVYRLAYTYLSYEEIISLANTKYSSVFIENAKLTKLIKNILLKEGEQ